VLPIAAAEQSLKEFLASLRARSGGAPVKPDDREMLFEPIPRRFSALLPLYINRQVYHSGARQRPPSTAPAWSR
jgi:hypothetical protein